MFLGFDIGNTSTVMGIYQDDAIIPLSIFRYDTDKKTDTENLASQIKDFLGSYKKSGGIYNGISGFGFSSVVPEINSVYKEVGLRDYSVSPLEIDCNTLMSTSINYKDPAEIGVDRIVNAEAAFRDYKGPSIVVDIGTAATFCVILENGTLDGGLIAPGIGTTIEALFLNASNLPRINFGKPDRLVARDTENAIKSGFFYGWISLIEGLINRIEAEYPGMTFTVILTGGFSRFISGNIERETVSDPFLTMKGIKYLYDLNKNTLHV